MTLTIGQHLDLGEEGTEVVCEKGRLWLPPGGDLEVLEGLSLEDEQELASRVHDAEVEYATVDEMVADLCR